MTQKRRKRNTRREMHKRKITGRKPMSSERKAELKKQRETMREAALKANKTTQK